MMQNLPTCNVVIVITQNTSSTPVCNIIDLIGVVACRGMTWAGLGDSLYQAAAIQLHIMILTHQVARIRH